MAGTEYRAASRAQAKKCSRCENTLPASKFTRSRQTRDGLKPWCKPCYAEYESSRRSDPVIAQAVRDADNARRARNPDARRAQERRAGMRRRARPGYLAEQRKRATARLEEAYKRSDPSKDCVVCGVAYCNLFGRLSHQRTCSEACSRSLRRQRCRDKQARRRAVLRGADAENINVFDVFERDGWRCHLCGRRTPKRMRGTIAPNAPELDHVVALADGGTHTWGNVACACRECNGKKGSESKGQLGLGFAITG